MSFSLKRKEKETKPMEVIKSFRSNKISENHAEFQAIIVFLYEL